MARSYIPNFSASQVLSFAVNFDINVPVWMVLMHQSSIGVTASLIWPKIYYSVVLTLSPPEGPYGPTVFIENCDFFRG